MKTFKEFIGERYYEPDEPLPSGKTPYGKATSSYYRQKGEYFRGGRQNPQHFDRAVKQIQRRNQEVSKESCKGSTDSRTAGREYCKESCEESKEWKEVKTLFLDQRRAVAYQL